MTTEASLIITFAIIFIILISVIIAMIFAFSSKKNKIPEKDLTAGLTDKEDDNKQKMYEIQILNELGNKIDYSLNIQDIIGVITGSLGEFTDYSAASYMILLPEKIIFKSTLQKNVSRRFIDEIKTEMTSSISALLNTDLKNKPIEETLFGEPVDDEADNPAGSFFNIPLVVNEEVVGLLTVAHIKARALPDR